MKKFLIKILTFILPIVVIGYSMDYYFSKKLERTNAFWGEYEVLRDIRSSSINAEVLIYGSSRAWCHIDPEIIGDSLNASVYNLGMDGQNFSFQYFLHNYYLNHNKQPRLIIHSLDNFTFDKRDHLVNKNKFLPFLIWDNDVRQFALNYEGYNTAECFLPLIRYSKQTYGGNNLFTYSLRENRERVRKAGYKPLPPKQKNVDQLIEELHEDNYEVQIDPQLVAKYIRFILELKEKHIRLVMVYSPEQDKIKEVLPERDRILRLYKKIAERYNISMYDFSGDILSENESYFVDITHMNETGAKAFSSSLAGKLKINSDLP